VVLLLLLAASVAVAACRRAARKRVEWERGAGRVHDGVLHARILGRTGGPVPVVLLHGFMGSGSYWGGAFDPLAESGALVVPDLLGFGRSPMPAAGHDGGGYDAEAHAAALLALLDELGVAAPAVVAGHSFGGLIGLRLASLRPDRVRAVVMFGPPLYRSAAEARGRIAGLDPLGGLLTLDTPLARRLCIWFHGHPRVSTGIVRALRPELPPPVARDASRHTWDSYWGTMERVILAADADRWLAAARVPVRVVAGVEDGMVDADFLAELASRHRHMEHRRLPGGHDLPLTAPRRCVGEIRLGLEGAS
jgi:pimeloyl-ACP methyl ester carboxylesterase